MAGTTGSDTLGSVLIRYNLITEQQLEEALEEQKRRGLRIGETLVTMGYLTEDMLTWCLANQLNVPCVSAIDTQPEQVDQKALELVPAAIAYKHHIVPLLLSGSELTVVTDDPMDKKGLARVAELTGKQLNIAAGTTSLVMSSIEALYGPPPAPEPQELALELAQARGSVAEPCHVDLYDWLERLHTAGVTHFVLRPSSSGGRVWLREQVETGCPTELGEEAFRLFLGRLRESTGAEEISKERRYPFTLEEYVGAVTFFEREEREGAAVRFRRSSDQIELPSVLLSEMRRKFSGPGLWLLGISSQSTWSEVAGAMAASLEPELNSWFGGEESSIGASLRAGRFSASSIENLVGLQPDVLFLPGHAEHALKVYFRGGLPDTCIVLQVAASNPIRVFQNLLGNGWSGAELAELTRGVICVNRMRLDPPANGGPVEPLEASGAESSGAEGANIEGKNAEAADEPRTSGGSSPLPSEHLVVTWVEASPEFALGLADGHKPRALAAFLKEGPMRSAQEQLQAFRKSGRLRAASFDGYLKSWGKWRA